MKRRVTREETGRTGTSGDPIALASLHATVLALIVGSFLGYALYAKGRFDDLTSALLAEVDRVNALPPPAGLAINPSLMGRASTAEGRQNLAKQLVHIAMGVPAEDLSRDPAERGRLAAEIMTALSATTPFPTLARQEGGGVGILGDPLPVRIDSVGAGRQWIENTRVLEQVLWVSEVHAETLYEVLAACDAREERESALSEEQLAHFSETMTAAEISKLRRLRSHALTQRIAERFLANSRDALGIATSVRARLAALDRFRSRQPSPTLLRGLFLWTIAVFLLAVVHPVLRTQSSWIPSVPRAVVLYGSTLLYVALLILSFVWTSQLLGD